MSDQEIYKSNEYQARIRRAERSLDGVAAQSGHYQNEVIKTAAESIAYWQMRAIQAEQLLCDISRNKNREL